MVIVFERLERREFFTAAQDLTSLTALRRDPAYSNINGAGIGIAILDSGTWAQNPDLRNNFAAYFDAVRNPASSAGSTNVASAVDPDGHGTHVAGIAASSNPDIGVATGARLIAVRALPADNEAQPSFDTVANGLQWVLNNVSRFNIKVVNLSLGVPSVNDNTGRLSDQESVLIDRLENLGVTVVAAAGNNYASFAPSPGASTPAAYSTLQVSNVWADSGSAGEFPLISGSGGTVRYFAQENDAAPDRFNATSQRSTLAGEIAAPGTDILSTWNSSSKLYQTLSGTSQAAPFISGTVALLQQAAFVLSGRYLTPDQVRTTLISSGDTIVDSNVSTNSRIPVTYDSSGNPRRAGSNQDLPETGLSFKRVNVYAAVRAVAALVTGSTDPTPPPTTPPATPPPTTPTTPPPVSGTDPDATIATATVVPNLDGNATFSFTGNVGLDGTVNVGPADVDVYRLRVLSPGVVSAALALPGGGTGFTPAVRLFNSAGVAIQGVVGATVGDYPTLVSGRLAPGTYYIGISAAGNTGYTISTRGGAVGTGAGGTALPGGDYSLTLGLANPDPNGVPQGSFDTDLLSPNSTDPRTGAAALFVAGTIGSDPNPLDETGPRVQIGAADVDMFRLLAPDDGVITVNTVAAGSFTHALDGVETYLRVFDSSFNELPVNLDFPNGIDAAVSFRVTRGGVYYVGVSSSGNTNYNATSSFDRGSSTGQTGAYDAYFSFDNGDANGTAYNATAAGVGAIGAAATAISAAVGTDGSVTIDGPQDATKDVDFYRYTVPQSGLIDLSAPGANGFAPVLALWRLSADRTSITRDADTSGRAARIIAPVTAGETVYVSVTGQGNDDFRWFSVASGSGGSSGAYTLTASMRPASDVQRLTNSSIQSGTPTDVFANTPIYANLGTTNAVETGPASVNLYRYVATFTGQVTVRATVPIDAPTDPFLRIFDQNGNELAYNDDADATTRDALITFNVTQGTTYYIGVNPSSADARAYNPLTGAGAAPGVEGDYILTVNVPPVVSVAGSTVQPAVDGNGPTEVTFTISIPAPTGQDVSADFATFDPGGLGSAVAGTDYTAVSRRVTIAAGETSATVTVAFAPDLTPGRFRVIGASLTNVTGARSGVLTTTATILAAVAAPPQATGPDLSAEAIALAPSGPVVSGDRVPAVLTLRSAGAQRIVGRFSVRTVISADPTYTPSDVPVAATRTVSVRLNPGQSQAVRLSVLIPAQLEAGTWYVIALLTALRGTSDEQQYNNLVSSTAQQVQWIYGTFAGHRNKTLTLTGGDGRLVRFAISGPGQGTVVRDDSGQLSTTVSGTSGGSSTLSLTPTGGSRITTSIFNLDINSPVRAILSTRVSVLGQVDLPTPSPRVVRVLGR